MNTYINHINVLIHQDLLSNKNFPENIRAPSIYALSSGKRLRPAIILSISCGISPPQDPVADHFALFIEYIHNASLIIDDLPCMDNDRTRRGLETVHVKYGEHIAQLLAINLLATAIQHSHTALKLLSPRSPSESSVDYLILQEITQCLSFQGVSGGQFLDLTIGTVDIDLLSQRQQREKILALIRLKTGCLFGLAFQLGWYTREITTWIREQDGSNHNLQEILRAIKECGIAFGMCYQIVDDIQDRESDFKRNGGYNNICKYYTKNELIDLFAQQMEIFYRISHYYNCFTPFIAELYKCLLNNYKLHVSS